MKTLVNNSVIEINVSRIRRGITFCQNIYLATSSIGIFKNITDSHGDVRKLNQSTTSTNRTIVYIYCISRFVRALAYKLRWKHIKKIDLSMKYNAFIRCSQMVCIVNLFIFFLTNYSPLLCVCKKNSKNIFA